MTAATPGREALADTSEFQVWKDDARRDDWHTRFVGSDIRQMLGEIERLTKEVRLAAKPADESFPISPSSLVAAWSRYVALFGEPPHGTEEQIRALLRLVPSTAGEPKR